MNPTFRRTLALSAWPLLFGLGQTPALAQAQLDFRTIGIYRQYPGNNTLSNWIVDSNANHAWDQTDSVYTFGINGDVPVMGDWKGTGHLQMGIFRQGLWAMDWDDDHTWSASDQAFSWGWAGDIPVVGDWTHTGKLQIGVVRLIGGYFYWYVNTSPACGSSNPMGCDYTYTSTYYPAYIQSFQYGGTGDIPVIGDWTHQSVLGVGIYRPALGTWYTNTNTSQCPPTSVLACNDYWANSPAYDPTKTFAPFGANVGKPIVGCWAGSCPFSEYGVLQLGKLESGCQRRPNRDQYVLLSGWI